MALFQNSVLKKYLKSQHTEDLKEKWAIFKTYFHNVTIQENIRNSKEEQFQEGFLRELFVKVLGYTLNPEPNFNLTTEYKNVKDSKKADGAIIINNHVKAVIELKGTDTTDLGKVESQAFNYKNNQPECVYVITSNFEKLRFYIENAIEHLEFNLFNLTEEEFHLLYVCLAHKNIESNVAKHIKDESVSQEDVITKKLYNDYSLFKRELYQNLVKLNPGYDQLELFKKSQKLLDRFLFVFFAEDRSLLPTNLIFRINKEWQQLREMRIEVSLYDRYKVYFNDLNHGAKVSLPAFSQTAAAKKEEYQIYAYNGGLFKDDEILNAVKIDDDVLFKHTEKLSNYDFASEVDVNILGHIFENSLNELDEIKAQLEGQEVEKTKTKRKKDGVFYTPKYITKYIVDNTVGKLCADKKAELQLNEADYTTDKKRQKKTLQDLSDKLNTYRNWLLQLTICDPACGSGAFLNQALDFLIAEHRYIDELQAKLFGDALVLSDVEGSILENNLFGVDINEESVEIAKLSLWLRTAYPNRKLNDLNSNIKCGNSLIDDVAVAGDKAFNWQQQFSQVFEKGGFDIVIGNPPYGINIKEDKDYFKKNYQSTEGPFELYKYFIERGIKLIKSKGVLGFITPDTWTTLSYFKKLRNILLNNYKLLYCSRSLYNVFPDAAVDTNIFIFENEKSTQTDFVIANITQPAFEKGVIEKTKDDYLIKYSIKPPIVAKIESAELRLGDVTEIWRGMSAYGAASPSKPYHSLSKETEYHRPILNGGDFAKYLIRWNGEFIKFGEWLHRPRPSYIYDNEKILVQRIRNPSLKQRIVATYDDDKFISTDGVTNILLNNNSDSIDLKFILVLINSKLVNYWFSQNYYDVNIKPEQLRNIPLVKISSADQVNFLDKANLMLTLNKELEESTRKFHGSLLRKFELKEISNRLKEWYLLSYNDFIKELSKKKIKLSLSEEAEWEEYFSTEAKKALELKAKIDATDKEIDQMVYKLYDLTEEEIKIVEGN